LTDEFPGQDPSQQPQYPPPPPVQQRPRKRHVLRNSIILGGAAVLALIVIAGALGSTTKGTKTHHSAPNSSSPSFSPTPTMAASVPLPCHARALTRRPRVHSTVKIRVRTAAHARVPATSTNGENASGRASARGQRVLRFRVENASAGTQVFVNIDVTRHSRTGSCQASFRPRRRPTPPPSSSAPPPVASCYPLTNGGNCYESGEFCRDSDHGVTGIAGNGEKIICEDNNGWRWEAA
jgi:hypothetical protein